MRTITKEVRERTIIEIIEDSVLWFRVKDGMDMILKANDPNDTEINFDVSDPYNGYFMAFVLMGIDDNDDLTSDLGGIFWRAYREKKIAIDVAKSIYIDWLVETKNHYIAKKETELTAT